jgi:two-component system sensor histidine kinase TctE
MSQNTAHASRPEPLSLRIRLVGILGAVLLLVMLALYAGIRVYSQAAADRSYDRLLSGAALSIAESLNVTHGKIQTDLPYAALEMLAAAPDDRVFYRVVGPDGDVATGYGDLPTEPASAEKNRSASLRAGEARFFDAYYRGADVRFAVLGRQISEPSAAGWVWVQVGQTRIARDALQRELIVGALAPLGFVAILTLALVWFGTDRALRPLKLVGDELASRGAVELDPIRTPVPREIAPLTSAIDGFMTRLAGNMDTLRLFIAEAAHQLRTPLAALRAQAEIGVDGGADDAHRSLVAIERNSAKMSRLLDQLLSHATVLHRADLQSSEMFDLLDIVHEAVHETLNLISDATVEIDHAIDAAPMSGDPVLIGESVKNLLHNALRYGSPNKDPISVSVGVDGRDYVVSVADHGPGIPVERREWVFERFTRGSPSTPGAGLGLHIVRRAVTSHGGSVTLRDGPKGGLIAEIRLPRATS